MILSLSILHVLLRDRHVLKIKTQVVEQNFENPQTTASSELHSILRAEHVTTPLEFQAQLTESTEFHSSQEKNCSAIKPMIGPISVSKKNRHACPTQKSDKWTNAGMHSEWISEEEPVCLTCGEALQWLYLCIETIVFVLVFVCVHLLCIVFVYLAANTAKDLIEK